MTKKKKKQPPASCPRGFASQPAREKRFDEQGRRIGDDGLPMTRLRTRAHRLLNGFFIWGVVAALLCAGFTVLAAFQGQVLSAWELIAVGGAHRNGFSVASLLRYEALFCLVVAVASVANHLYGFSWFYDGYTLKPVRRITAGLGLACALWFAAAALLVGVFEPVSFLTIVLLALLWALIPKVFEERVRLAAASSR